MLCDFQIFWFNHFRQPRLESVVDRIFQPRNRHEIRAALAQHLAPLAETTRDLKRFELRAQQ